jgi:hypothetical protein
MIKLQEKETHQATFDLVVGKLREQGEPSVTQTPGVLPTCVYGKPGGHRCAAGHLLGDNEITGSYTVHAYPLDGSSLTQLINHGVIEEPAQRRLISELQSAHDDPAVGLKLRGKTWAAACAKRMLIIAEQFNLSPASASAWLESLQ